VLHTLRSSMHGLWLKVHGQARQGLASARRAGLLTRRSALRVQDFQFFNIERLTQLFDREHAVEQHKHALKAKEDAARAQARPQPRSRRATCPDVSSQCRLVTGVLAESPGWPRAGRHGQGARSLCAAAPARPRARPAQPRLLAPGATTSAARRPRGP